MFEDYRCGHSGSLGGLLRAPIEHRNGMALVFLGKNREKGFAPVRR
jgi:hypothetical protein